MPGQDTPWYKNAVVYAVDVEAFQDSTGSGVGDFAGLTSRLDYLNHLGVNCLWLLPFYPTPNRDNGYDVADYYGVDDRHGTLGDFVDFVTEAEERGIHVLIDLVVNHTSDQHPWFQRAREGDARYRDYYVWSENPPEEDPDRGSVFPGEVEDARVWTYDDEAGAYYYHRFYPFQPDLDLSNPDVRDEIRQIMNFWLRLGVDGFRLDAATLMIQEKRPGMPDYDDPFELLSELRANATHERGDVVFMAEADDEPSKLPSYARGGGGMDMLLNFPGSAHLFAALATGRAETLDEMYDLLPDLSAESQWVNFLRNYDELNLGRLSAALRDETFDAIAPDEEMRIYGRGVRRRLAPMLDGDRDRLELAFSLLFSMPGTPLLTYGDEIGMGEDLSLPGRTAVRTPMQWSAAENAGFSDAPADDLVRPVVSEGRFGYDRVNVADQWATRGSLLNFVEHLIGMRHETPEIGAGETTRLDTDDPAVFANRFDHEGRTVLVAHNLADDPVTATLDLDGDAAGGTIVGLLGDGEVRTTAGVVEIDLGAFGYRWLRIAESPRSGAAGSE